MTDTRQPTPGELSAFRLGTVEGLKEAIEAVDELHAFMRKGADPSLTDDAASPLVALRLALELRLKNAVRLHGGGA